MHTHTHTHTHSVGTIVAIPVSVVVDLMVQHFLPSWQAFVGIILILAGFTGFVVSEFLELKREWRDKTQLVESDKLKNTTGSDDTCSDDLPNETEPLLSSPAHVDQQRMCRRFIVDHLI